jgi:hypothetical protein
MAGSSAVGSRSKLLSPSTAAFPHLSRSPLPALRNMPVLQRVWVSSYLQAVRMQRMALREGAATKEPGAAAPKTGLDFFSKFAAASAADAPAKAPLDSEASDLGSREDRPLFVTTVDAAKRRRIPWYCSRAVPTLSLCNTLARWAVWLGKGVSYWVLLVVVLYLYDQMQQSMMGSANKIMGGRKRVRCLCSPPHAPPPHPFLTRCRSRRKWFQKKTASCSATCRG